MAIGDIVRLFDVQRYGGSDVVNTWHFQQIGTGLPPDMLTRLLNGWESEILPVMRACQSTILIHRSLRVEMMVGGDSLMERDIGLAGLRIGVELPPQAATLFSLRSAAIGRSRRGRVYLAAGSGSDQSAGVWGTTHYNSRLIPLRDRIMTVYGPLAVDWQLGVWSRKLGGNVPPYNPAGYIPVSEILVDTIVRTQRRRQVNVGT